MFKSKSEEYLCPICHEIFYKPIRLNCGHLYCLGCLRKAKKSNYRDCPICREPNALYNADISNLDRKLMNKLMYEFPKEILENEIKNKIDDVKEYSKSVLHVNGYGNPNQCIIM